MLKFIQAPLKIDHSNKVVYMTLGQFDANKSQISKGGETGWQTKDGSYTICVCFCHAGYFIPVPILFDILWQCIRALEVMYHTHCNNEEFKAIIARVFLIHQSLIPYGAGIQMPIGIDVSKTLADNKGLVLLQDVISMPVKERNKLVEHDRQEGKKTYPKSPIVSIKGEKITVDELANYIRYGCEFMIFDANTTTRPKFRRIDLYSRSINGLIMSYLLCGNNESDAVDNVLLDLPLFSRDDVEHYVSAMKL